MKAPEHYNTSFFITRHPESTLGAENRYAGGYVPSSAMGEWKSGGHVGVVPVEEAKPFYTPELIELTELGEASPSRKINDAKRHPSDVGITDRGREQAEAAAAVLRAMPSAEAPTDMYSSLMRRTEEHADILHNQGLIGTRRWVVPLLNERDWGELMGQPKRLVQPEPADFGGEKEADYAERVRAGVSAVLADAEERRARPMIVAHKGTMQALLGGSGHALPKKEEEGNAVIYKFTPKHMYKRTLPPHMSKSDCPWVVERVDMGRESGVQYTPVELRKIVNAVAPGDM